MFIRLVGHLRSNVIAYLALGISLLGLAGGAYAAFTLPANSVGARQIRNGSIAPVKFDHSLIGGSIRAWAQVNAQGQVVASSGGAREVGQQPGAGGQYVIAWPRDTFSPQRCAVIANTVEGLTSASGGFASTYTYRQPSATLIDVRTLSAQAIPTSEAFSLAVIC